MWQYVVKRLLLMIPTLIGAALVIFFLMNLVPGDVALLIIGGDQGGDINAHELAKLRQQLGLNRPLYVQFLSWLWGIVHLDFGKSLWTGASVIEELMIRLPLSLEVAIAATLVSIVIAIPLGTLAAIRQDSWVDYVVRVISIGGLAMPAFWTGILIILFLVPVTLMMHQFWTAIDPMIAADQMAHFVKNVSLIGSALFIFYFGSGPLSLDARKRSYSASRDERAAA